MEIGTHPDDLCIECGEIKGHPGKYLLNILRGRGHRYKPLLTSDRPESWKNSKAEQLQILKSILTGSALQALYHGHAPATFEEFAQYANAAGFAGAWLPESELKMYYGRVAERGASPLLGAMIDPNRCLNAYMIDEILARFETSDVVDTSTEPLKSFQGAPTSPPHRLA